MNLLREDNFEEVKQKVVDYIRERELPTYE